MELRPDAAKEGHDDRVVKVHRDRHPVARPARILDILAEVVVLCGAGVNIRVALGR